MRIGRTRQANAVAIKTLLARRLDLLVAELEVAIRASFVRDLQLLVGAGANGGSVTASTAKGTGRRRKKRILPCIAPNCRNPSKGPRFHFLCDTHRGAPQKDYVAWRAARAARPRP